MTENKLETISSLIDDHELTEEQLVDVIKDEKMSDTWQRYHLIGDVLRDDVPPHIDLDLSRNIASAIAAEPTVLAPQKNTLINKVKNNVVKLAKPIGQVAIAASAATLMIMGVQQNVTDTEQLIPNQVVQTTPFAGVADPVSLNIEQIQTTKELDYEQQQRRFHALLADHQQRLKLKQTQQEQVEIESAEANTSGK